MLDIILTIYITGAITTGIFNLFFMWKRINFFMALGSFFLWPVPFFWATLLLLEGRNDE